MNRDRGRYAPCEIRVSGEFTSGRMVFHSSMEQLGWSIRSVIQTFGDFLVDLMNGSVASSHPAYLNIPHMGYKSLVGPPFLF
jgi:hypothetical protein